MNEKVKESLNKVLEAFKSGEIAECVAYSAISMPNIPSSKWSITNRIITWVNGTADARGFQQWRQINRNVKKGAKAFHIIAPYVKTIEDARTEKKEEKIVGFHSVPVFRFEDTEGAPLQETAKIPLPKLADIAEKFGVSVNFSGSNPVFWGVYSHSNKTIILCTPDEHVFFHELAHAAHYRVRGDKLSSENKCKKEIVAELAACAISRLFGKRLDGNSYRYIESYAREANLNPYNACIQVLCEVETVLNEIFTNTHINDVK